jgi:hypothetical protein
VAGLRLRGGLAGAKEVQREIKRLTKAAPQAVARALYQQGFEVQAAAVRLAPVEAGVLRSSGYVSPPEQEGGGPSVEVGFGTVYAAVQHEREDFHHPRGGEAKYLQKAVAQKASLERLAALARSNFEKGIGTEALPKLAPSAPPNSKRAKRRGTQRAARKQRRAKRKAELAAKRKLGRKEKKRQLREGRARRRDLKRAQKRRKTRGRKRKRR